MRPIRVLGQKAPRARLTVAAKLLLAVGLSLPFALLAVAELLWRALAG